MVIDFRKTLACIYSSWLWGIPLVGATPIATVETDPFQLIHDMDQDLSRVHLQIMAPLLVFDPTSSLESDSDQERRLRDFSKSLVKEKSLGVGAVTVDLWWSIPWHYYDRVFQVIENAGLEIIPNINVHACGGNPGDHGTNIPLPAEILKNFMSANPNEFDGRYVSETGEPNHEVLSPYAFHKTRPVFQEFWLNRLHKMAKYKKSIRKINLGIGPSGEISAPSYHSHDWKSENARFPNRGNFQASSALARESFYHWLFREYQPNPSTVDMKLSELETQQRTMSAINQRWKTAYKYFQEIDFFANTDQVQRAIDSGEIFEPRWQDFTRWYSSVHSNYVRDMVLAFDEIAQQTSFAKTRIAIKINGIYWGYLALLTAGHISTAGANPAAPSITDKFPSSWSLENGLGLAAMFEPLKGLENKLGKNRLEIIYTCMGMADCRAESIPKSELNEPPLTGFNLAVVMGKLANKIGALFGLENALEHHLWDADLLARAYHQIILTGVHSVTFLRGDSLIDNPTAQEFIRKLRAVRYFTNKSPAHPNLNGGVIRIPSSNATGRSHSQPHHYCSYAI